MTSNEQTIGIGAGPSEREKPGPYDETAVTYSTFPDR